MRLKAVSRVGWVALGLFVVLAAVVFIAPQTGIFNQTVLDTAGRLAQVSIVADSSHIGRDGADFRGVVVRSLRGEPLARIAHLSVSYNLRDALLPGGKRLFGLSAMRVERPQVTIIHRPDGSYNVPLQSFSSKSSGVGPPLITDVRVIDGSVEVIDQTRVDPAARHLYLDAVQADGHLDTSAQSHYTASLAYREDAREYPIRGGGDSDVASGFMLHHFSAAQLPVARLLDYGINSNQARVLAGVLRYINVRYVGLSGAAGKAQPHLAASAELSDMTIAASPLAVPIRDVHGHIDAYENGLVSTDLRAGLGDIPLRLSGGVYDLQHPTLRAALNGNADAATLCAVVPQAAHLPVSGPLAFAITVEGSAQQPAAYVRVRSPQVVYNHIPLQNLDAVIAADGAQADIVALHGQYSRFAVDARGHVGFARKPGALAIIARADGPAAGLPYLNGATPGMDIHGIVLATGEDPAKIATRGLIYGQTPTQQLDGTFAISDRGTGTLGPLSIERASGESLYARAAIGRDRGRLAALVSAHDFTLTPAAAAALPGFSTIPAVSLAGTLDADVFLAQRSAGIATAGNALVRNARVGTFGIDRASARFDGGSNGLNVSSLAARGPWGSLDGAGSVVARPGGALVQLRGTRIDAATARGPQQAVIDATLALRGDTLDLYAAHASAPGVDAIASGSVGGRSAIALSAVADAHALRAQGLPVGSGTVAAAATIGGSLRAPSARGSVVGDRVVYRGASLDSATVLAFGGDTLTLSDGFAAARPGFVSFDGTVGGLTPSAVRPRYALTASARAADLGTLATIVAPKFAGQLGGEADADVFIRGSGKAPTLAGSLAIVEGSYHGLGFTNLRTNFTGDARAIALQNGSVRIGTTAAAFQGRSGGPQATQLALNMPHVDLRDFNDYFDGYPALAGLGSASFSLQLTGGALSTAGNARFADLRYRRIALDAANARWSTAAQTVHLDASAGGTSGRVALTGSVRPGTIDFNRMSTLLQRSRLDLVTSVRDLDTATWSKALGYEVPLAGLVDADATVHGYYPSTQIAANANLHNGIYQKIPIQTLAAALTLQNGKGTLRSAELTIPGLDVAASGTFGIQPNDRLNLTTRAHVSDVATLEKEFTTRTDDISGSVDTSVALGGTRLRPAVAGIVTVSSLRYAKFTIPRIIAQFSGDRTKAAVSGGEIDLQKGRALFAGSVPLTVQRAKTFSLAAEPVSFDLAADDVELANFVGLLPAKTALAGRIDGSTTLRGTVSAPSFGGSLTLANGSFSGPQESVPITNMRGTLAFSGTTIAVQGVSADVGGGTVTSSGTIAIPDVHDPTVVTLALKANADNARVDLPAYFKGNIDAALTIDRNAGAPLRLGGTVALSKARVPVSALYSSKPAGATTSKPPDVMLGLALTVGDDVRVISPSVDVGGKGNLTIGGTLAKPAIDGRITSTDGTLDFYRHFRLQRAVIAFDPSSGVIPDVNATANTSVTNPDTNIQLHVTGPADNLNIGLASDPAYTREQILGLLVGVQQLGALSGVQTSSGGSFSASNAAQQLALGQVNGVFTRNLLQPLSSQLAAVTGLNDFSVYNDLGSGFGLNLGKSITKNLSVEAGESFGVSRRSSISIVNRFTNRLRARLTFFQSPPQVFAASSLPAFGTPQSVGQLQQIQNTDEGTGFRLDGELKF